MENKTAIHRLIKYFEQQLRLQGDPQFKETSQETLVDAIRVCKNALKLEKQSMKQIAELAFDAGYNRSEDEWRCSIHKESIELTKEQFIKELFP